MSKIPLHIVLAEDDTDDRESIDEALQIIETPIESTFVSNGEELIHYLQGVLHLKPENLPQIIVLDVNMPKMNGKEALKKIKAIDELKNIPVVTLTTSKDAELKSEMEQLGSCAVYTKPNTVREFKMIVMDMIKTCLPNIRTA